MAYVYVLSNPSYPEGTYKIGHTTKTMQERLAGLNNTSVPTPFKVEAQYEVLGEGRSALVERYTHKNLKPYRLNKGREFFGNGLTLDDIHIAVVSNMYQGWEGTDNITPQTLRDDTRAREQALIDERKANEDRKLLNNIHEEALCINKILIDFTDALSCFPTKESLFEYKAFVESQNKIKTTYKYKLFGVGLAERWEQVHDCRAYIDVSKQEHLYSFLNCTSAKFEVKEEYTYYSKGTPAYRQHKATKGRYIKSTREVCNLQKLYTNLIDKQFKFPFYYRCIDYSCIKHKLVEGVANLIDTYLNDSDICLPISKTREATLSDESKKSLFRITRVISDFGIRDRMYFIQDTDVKEMLTLLKFLIQ